MINKHYLYLIGCLLVVGSFAAVRANDEQEQATYSVTRVILKQSLTSLGRILTDGRGMTVYYFPSDIPYQPSKCYDTCALVWPPVYGIPEAQGDLAGEPGYTVRADGSFQATYQGYPLYYFVNDIAPGQTSGEGVQNVSYVLHENGLTIVNSNLGPIVSLDTGKTVYYKTSDSYNPNLWKPVLGFAQGANGVILPGTIAWITMPNGQIQASYEGWPLWTYAGDTGRGQTNGNNVDGFFAFKQVLVDTKIINLGGSNQITINLCPGSDTCVLSNSCDNGTTFTQDGKQMVKYNCVIINNGRFPVSHMNATLSDIQNLVSITGLATKDGVHFDFYPDRSNSPLYTGYGHPWSYVVTSSSKPTSVLIDATSGLTLYIFKNDKPYQPSTCKDRCAVNFPPFLGFPTVAGHKELNGQLGTQIREDGNMQVAWNGFPLYTFSNDIPGSAKGQGVGGVWEVAKGAPIS